MRPFSIRNKLFIAFSLLGLIALSTSFIFVYSNAKSSLQVSIKDQLDNSTTLITTLVQSVASTSIENHLRSIAETQLLQVHSMYQEFLAGRFSEEEAKHIASSTLKLQIIGTSGYFYCIDSQGNVPVHPNAGVEGTNILSYSFVKDQVRLKDGYIEYRWKNPGEEQARDKVLYMIYFEPWDWIISASTYKSEFNYLIDIENLSKALDKVQFGEHGYPFIFSTDGDAIYHPQIEGNIYSLDLDSEMLASSRKILSQKNGTIYYNWKNPNDHEAREKISILEFLPEYHWIVGSSAYIDELYLPLQQIKRIFLLIFCVYGLLILGISYGLSSLVTGPLKKLMDHFKDSSATDVPLITVNLANDEIGKLAGYLNQFIVKLNEHHLALDAEIGERKRSEQTFHTLFDHSFQFIALLDTECRVWKINKTALSFRQLKEEDVLGMYFWDTPWWNHSEALIKQLKEAFSLTCLGNVARFEAYSDEIKEVFLDITMKPVLDDEGQVIFIIAEARDITELRQAEQELQQVQKMESVGTLAGGIAHDFNNILGGILGTIDLVKLKQHSGEALSEDELLSCLDTIGDTALRARDIVNQLLNLSRKYDLNIVSVNLAQVLDNVCRIGENSFDKSVEINQNFAADLPVKGDVNSLEQVFLNILINAAHAMTIMRTAEEPWGGELRVEVASASVSDQLERSAGDYWKVSIRDSGVGIDSDKLEQIFVPFYTTKNMDDGTGLGLSMVYNIIRQHGGFVEVDSQPGKGSCFDIYLPVCQEAYAGAGGEQKAFLEYGQGLILVIDDESLIRTNTAAILETSGYRVLKAENGKEGVEIYKRFKGEINLVVLDLVMPVMSGRDTYLALKEIDPRVQVLLTSGFSQDDRVKELLEAGVSGFIQKPYSLFSLSQAVKNILEDKRPT